MSLWLLAILLLAIFGGIGFAKGAIRTSISLVGLILGLALAIPLGRHLQPLMPKIGVTNPVWIPLISPVIVFALIYLAATALSFLAHHKVYLIYKYKRDDVDRIRWERMNRRVGAGVGMLTGTILFLFVGGLIYAAGYLTVQLSAEENSPGTIKFINSARLAMAENGFDKVAARFQPASKLYYEAADILGLLYHNPLLQSRLATYPYFLGLGERPEFQEIANDKEYNDLIFGKAPITQIINHPKTQLIMGNTEALNYLKGTDLADLKEYLKTGKSPKYDDQEILGVWHLDKDAVVTFVRKANPDIKAKDLRAMRQALQSLPPVMLVATPENKVIVKTGAAAQPAEPQTQEAPPEDSEAARYNRQPGAGRQRSQPAAAPVPSAPSVAIPQFSGEGSWAEEAGQYVITLNDASGKSARGTASIKGDEMILSIAGTSLIFVKQ